MAKPEVYIGILTLVAVTVLLCFFFLLLSPDPPLVPEELPPANISGKLDINTASAQELAALPSVSSSLAADIVTYREVNGPFRNLGELLDIDGLGEKTLEAMIPYITVGGS